MKKTKNKQKTLSKAGFSLVEVLISLLVLTAGITAIMSLMTGNIKNANETKTQIIAGELAQEGIEIVRNMSDNGLSPLVNAGTFTVDSGAVSALYSAAGTRLFFDGNFYGINRFGVSGAVPTKFYRKIEITKPNVGFSQVESFVTWSANGSFATPCSFSNKCISTIAVYPE